MRLAGAVRPEEGDTLCVEHLEVEGSCQPLECQRRASERPLAGAASLQAHRDPLRAGDLLGRPGLDEAVEAVLRRAELGGEVVVVGAPCGGTRR